LIGCGFDIFDELWRFGKIAGKGNSEDDAHYKLADQRNKKKYFKEKRKGRCKHPVNNQNPADCGKSPEKCFEFALLEE
jgi:hypothetical protein